MFWIAVLFVAWLAVSVPASLLLGALIREVGAERRARNGRSHRGN